MNTEILHSIVQLDGVGEKNAVLLYEVNFKKDNHDSEIILKSKTKKSLKQKEIDWNDLLVTGSLSKPRKEIQELIKSAEVL